MHIPHGLVHTLSSKSFRSFPAFSGATTILSKFVDDMETFHCYASRVSAANHLRSRKRKRQLPDKAFYYNRLHIADMQNTE